VAGQMDLPTSHSVQFREARVMCTILLSLAKEEHCGGMHISHGLEQPFMVPLSFFPKDMFLTLSLNPSGKFPLYWVS